ncbi:hypothetical protein E2562_020160 [Oryza meyeriana var. granulata]|uniref:Uncharacterized protein n=1 Tax=Oryza meyeriana var. granulata TaxID=110450 RepID=A0A6G1BM55_9ORYZ|nr:hypothetical protein E2562_020160 [Oryza meyeriana var. granulata]
MWSWCGGRRVASVAEREEGPPPRRRGGRRPPDEIHTPQPPRIEPPRRGAPPPSRVDARHDGPPPASGAASRIPREEEQAKTAAVAAESSWSELPADLIAQVLLRLPSLADRVRLRAVCRPWRDGPRGLPPPLPWLALRDGGLVDLHGTSIRSAPVLREGVCSFLAVDNLSFLVHTDGGCSLVNPLSGSAGTPLPQLANAVLQAMKVSKFYTPESTKVPYAKVIMSSPLDSSPDPLIAALILDKHYVVISACKRPGAIGIGYDYNMPLADIVFLHGRLYTLTMKEGLYVYGPNIGCLSEPMNVSSGFHQCIIDDPKEQELNYFLPGLLYVVLRYLAECDGRLFLVRRWMSVPPHARLGDEDRTCWFEVFEADLTITPCRWTKVHHLGGHAIFLGSECTKFVRASQFADDMGCPVIAMEDSKIKYYARANIQIVYVKETEDREGNQYSLMETRHLSSEIVVR